jgi:ERCC4-type nuclease
MLLVVDDRERLVLPHFTDQINKKYNHSIKTDRICYGDYAIYRGKKLLYLIERKSWKDLSASLRDGRKDNVNKLLHARDESGCKLFYLIEGSARMSLTHKIARIPYKNLLAHLDHLMIRDNIHIIYSKNTSDTASRLIELMDNTMTLNLPESDTKTDTVSCDFDLKKTLPTPDSSYINDIWNCIPGVSDATRACLSEKYTLCDLIRGNFDADAISNLTYGSGTVIGKKRAHKITSSLNCPDLYVKMLTCIKGVTKQTATLIIKEIGMDKLIEGKCLQDLAELKKTEKRKLGQSVATEILRIFGSV